MTQNFIDKVLFLFKSWYRQWFLLVLYLRTWHELYFTLYLGRFDVFEWFTCCASKMFGSEEAASRILAKGIQRISFTCSVKTFCYTKKVEFSAD